MYPGSPGSTRRAAGPSPTTCGWTGSTSRPAAHSSRAEALLLFSRWITPPQVKIRFDTLFYLVAAPEDAEPRPDGGETVDVGWYAPQAALDAGIELVFPTIKTLEALAGFGSADELLAWAEGREVEPIEPMVVIEGEVARVVLPGEPGYRD